MKRKPKPKTKTSKIGEIVVPPPQIPVGIQPPWKVTHHGRNVHVVDVPFVQTSGKSQWILLLADNHTDNPSADRKMEERLLREAVEKKAIICSIGDTLDLMGGKSDKRQNKAAMRSSLLASNYFDAVIEDAANFYSSIPGAVEHWAVLGEGNHESAYRNKSEVCPVQNLARAMKSRVQSQLQAGGYTGWIVVRLNINKTILPFTLYYAHGASSGGQQSMGILDAKRTLAYVEGCDMICMSHTHDSNVAGTARLKLDSHNGLYQVKQRHVDFCRIGSTKNEWKAGEGSWIVEKGVGPKPIRQKWVRLWVQWESHKPRNGMHRGRPRLCWDVIDAQ